MGKITDAKFVESISASNSLLGNFGGALGQITLDNLRKHLNDNDEQVLQDLAYYIDINKPSSLGSTRVDTGGNMGMRAMWEGQHMLALMDKNGNFTELNRHDGRYTADTGEYILNEDGTLISAYDHCDIVVVPPKTYGRIQLVTMGDTTIERLWLSLMPLPGGFDASSPTYGKFKAHLDSTGALRSVPGYTVQGSQTIRQFWERAQLRSKDHGITNMPFRMTLLYHMMGKYGWRDSQNCATSDGTKVWGVGLDGTENTTGSSKDGLTRQFAIRMGATLSLGLDDGKVAVTDSEGGTCHKISVLGAEDAHAQFWEVVGGMYSVGTDVYLTTRNIVPSGTPDATSFANIPHVKLTRSTSNTVTKASIIQSGDGQGVYYVPSGSLSGVSYGDSYFYSADGQVWLFGGYSSYGSSCGLAFASSFHGWSSSASNISARLAYYGEPHKVSSSRLKELKSA